MYQVYYISSNGQPANGLQTIGSFRDALDCWLSYCGGLYRRESGKAVLTDVQSGDDLVWFEAADGGHVTGTMAQAFADAHDPVISPAEVVAALSK